MSALPGSPVDWLLYGGRGPSWLPGGGGASPFGFPQQQTPAPAPTQPMGFRDKFRAAFSPSGPLNNPDLAMALLANSGPSMQPKSFGSILGQSMLQARGMQDQRSEDELMRRYREAQIAHLQQPGGSQPSSVQEYEYAKKNGFTGSFQDWIVAGGQTSRPSSVQEWEFFNNLDQENQRRYLEMKRNPNWKVGEVNQVPTVISGLPGGGVQTTPLSNLPAVAGAAETVKQAEGRGGAVGKAQGEITGGVLTKGSNAKSTIATLDLADLLIDAATGSAVGAGRDKLAAFFGEAPTGAQAIAQLRVLQANLMTSMPRMEGPQSDKDVELYRQAAGQIGDPTVPAAIKKAAVKTIRALQNKSVERANSAGGANQADPLGIR